MPEAIETLSILRPPMLDVDHRSPVKPCKPSKIRFRFMGFRVTKTPKFEPHCSHVIHYRALLGGGGGLAKILHSKPKLCSLNPIFLYTLIHPLEGLPNSSYLLAKQKRSFRDIRFQHPASEKSHGLLHCTSGYIGFRVKSKNLFRV